MRRGVVSAKRLFTNGDLTPQPRRFMHDGVAAGVGLWRVLISVLARRCALACDCSASGDHSAVSFMNCFVPQCSLFQLTSHETVEWYVTGCFCLCCRLFSGVRGERRPRHVSPRPWCPSMIPSSPRTLTACPRR